MKKHLTHRLAAVATAGVLSTAIASDAFATTAGNLTDVTAFASNMTNATGTTFPLFMSALSYIGGGGLTIAGIYKLKNHVDNPGQTPMKDGLIRLGAGGALLSITWFQRVMQGAASNGSTSNAAVLSIASFS